MHRKETLSTTHQMYLKTLLQLGREHPVGRVKDLAQELGVTPGTVSTALTRLEEQGLIEREHYGGAQLTATGTAVAECVERRFEILCALLIEVLGVDKEVAEMDACMMEHAVSPMTLNRMSRFLDRLHSGASFDMESLQRSFGRGENVCTSCEALQTCQAVETASA